MNDNDDPIEHERNESDSFDELGIFADKSIIEKELRRAMKNKLKVTIHAQGTYKGVTGYIMKIERGHVYVDTPVSKTIIPFQRIQWVDVFKPEAEEKE